MTAPDGLAGGLQRLLHAQRFASVYVAFEAFPRPKGASTHIAAMTAALTAAAAPVLLLCCGHGESPTFQREGDVVIVRHRGHDPNFLQRTLDFGRFVGNVLATLPSAPDLIVFRDPWGGAPAQVAWPDTPSIFEVNALPSWELSTTWPAFAYAPALRAKVGDIERRCLERATGIVTVSPVTRAALGKMGVGAGKMLLEPNCAATAFFEADGEGSPIGVLKTGRWFGYVGSNHPWQGLDDLITAWSMVEADWPDVRLLIISGGAPRTMRPLRKRLRKLGLAERIFVHDPLSQPDLARALPHLEFTCAPLRDTARNVVQGCCPVKIVESMAAGVPVLASDLSATRWLIRPDVDGVLVPAGQPRIWAHAITRVLGDATLRQALGAAARATARGRFHPYIVQPRLSEMFSRVMHHTWPS